MYQAGLTSLYAALAKGNITLSTVIINEIYKAIRDHGLVLWYEHSTNQLSEGPSVLFCPHCNGRIADPPLASVEALLLTASSYREQDAAWDSFLLAEDEEFDIENLGKVVVVEQQGGYEDAGRHAHMIFKVTAPDGTVKFYKKSGTYDSWDGTTWDGPFVEVRCETRTITAYPELRSKRSGLIREES